jgi:hypothetical protein
MLFMGSKTIQNNCGKKYHCSEKYQQSGILFPNQYFDDNFLTG